MFDRILGDYTGFAAQLNIGKIVPIPISALAGDNITEPSGNMPWYRGPSLMQHLETVEVARRVARRAVPHAGAVGEPAEPGFPRLFRHGPPAAPSIRAIW